MRPLIEATLSTTATASKAVEGWRVGWGENHAKSPLTVTTGAVQVVYPGTVTTGNFEVEFQAGIQQTNGTVKWGEVATIDQTGVDDPVTFTVAPGMLYRFSHSSGIAVVCLLI